VSSSFQTARFPSLALTVKQEVTVEQENTKLTVEEPSDETLISRICADDSEALGLLFTRYARLAWTIGLRILRNSEEADDLLQDVFLLVRRRASAFDISKGSVRSLLVQMCYQRAFSRRRDLTRRNFYFSGEVTDKSSIATPPSWVPLYEESLEAQFGKNIFKKAFEDLSRDQRETLRMCFFEGHTLEEIAVRLGQSCGNVRHHYYRGLSKLRKHVKGSP